ncbi:hypothetical protein VPH35_110760 [Triticum aestivum]
MQLPSPTRPTPTRLLSIPVTESQRRCGSDTDLLAAAMAGLAAWDSCFRRPTAARIPQSPTCSSYAQLVHLPLKATTAAAEDQWQPWLVSIRRAAAVLGACRLLGISGRQRAPVQGGPRRRISEPPCS